MGWNPAVPEHEVGHSLVLGPWSKMTEGHVDVKE